jgi:rhodanese-related sulfurtransferase
VASGLEVGSRGGIRVNEYMQTSDLDIYAVGDAVEVRDYITGDAIQIPLAGPANRQGRIAADHIFGRPSSFRGMQGTAVVEVFGMTAAMTGMSEKALQRKGLHYEKVYLHPTHHAGYYPGAERMSLKLLFDPESGKILGAQAVGASGVDKRIDVLAIAIQADMTVFDLEEAELAYAPQFGAAKDPINMAGFIAAGVVRGDAKVAHAADLAGASILDVRTRTEFEGGHIPGAVNLPLEQLRERLGEVDRRRRTIAYCQSGQRGYQATRILAQAGYDIANLSGGYLTYCQSTSTAVGAAEGAKHLAVENLESTFH